MIFAWEILAQEIFTSPDTDNHTHRFHYTLHTHSSVRSVWKSPDSCMDSTGDNDGVFYYCDVASSPVRGRLKSFERYSGRGEWVFFISVQPNRYSCSYSWRIFYQSYDFPDVDSRCVFNYIFYCFLDKKTRLLEACFVCIFTQRMLP